MNNRGQRHRIKYFKSILEISIENIPFNQPQPHDSSNCPKCKLVENERDTLRAQLNREIGMKEEQMATNDELERNLREMRRRMEELRGELQQSQQKVEDIE